MVSTISHLLLGPLLTMKGLEDCGKRKSSHLVRCSAAALTLEFYIRSISVPVISGEGFAVRAFGVVI